MTLTSAAITLLLIMDPLGNIPMFLSILNNVKPSKRRAIILREAIFALIILTLFLLFGQYILNGMGLSQPALSIAGGIILFLMAVNMIFPKEDRTKQKLEFEPFIVPLAVPLIAGPSSMAMIMLIGNQAPYAMPRWFAALLIAWAITTIILVFADNLRKLLGVRGLIAMERLMGMILTTMAVQMLLNGLDQFIHA